MSSTSGNCFKKHTGITCTRGIIKKLIKPLINYLVVVLGICTIIVKNVIKIVRRNDEKLITLCLKHSTSA